MNTGHLSCHHILYTRIDCEPKHVLRFMVALHFSISGLLPYSRRCRHNTLLYSRSHYGYKHVPHMLHPECLGMCPPCRHSAARRRLGQTHPLQTELGQPSTPYPRDCFYHYFNRDYVLVPFRYPLTSWYICDRTSKPRPRYAQYYR